MSVTRRRFLSGSGLTLAAVPFANLVRPETLAAAQAGGVFRHGVASGDPRADRVILWTRVSGATGEVPVRWTLAANPQFTRVVARGETPTGAARDFTVKVDVTGLAPATTYYYRFDALGGRSPVGRTRTLPGAGAATGARSRWPRAPTTRTDSSTSTGGSPSAPTSTSCCTSATTSTSTNRADTPTPTLEGRAVDPADEILALDDYRRRYALYRTDPDLQEAHRQHPFIGGVGRPRDRQQHLERRRREPPARAKATSSPAATPPTRRSSSGCRCATPVRPASRSSTARSPSAISPIW